MTSYNQEYLHATFKALTDALLPASTLMNNGQQQIYQASDLFVHEYIIYALDHYITIQQHLYQMRAPLAYPTALMLDVAATYLLNHKPTQSIQKQHNQHGGVFTTLSRKDRVRTLACLENLEVDLYSLPSPFQNDAGLVQYVTDALNRFAYFGNYSEWPAYGTTRNNPPQNRQLQYHPLGWSQVGYPGPSYGYRDFRGFLLRMGRTGGET
ncbi:hypothetical protein [Halalkalibacter wakoensis]|nr:hypothetical protein [Halalkalibacter wakoensis]